MQLSQIPVQTPTPFYYYNLELLKKTVQAAKSGSAPYGYRVHYAVKANANPVLLRLISQQGLGADCVSGNEIRQALGMRLPGRYYCICRCRQKRCRDRTCLTARYLLFQL